MNYYEIYDRMTGYLIAKGNARECKEALGCSSLDTFYALANRSRRGINKTYRVVVKKGGETNYPVLGEKTPMTKIKEEEHERTEKSNCHRL